MGGTAGAALHSLGRLLGEKGGNGGDDFGALVRG